MKKWASLIVAACVFGPMTAQADTKALEEAAKKELWLQLVEARQAAGLTQADMAMRLGVTQSQVARIEKRGYDAYTLTTLRRYVDALGGAFELEVQIRPRVGLRQSAGS